MRSPLAVPMMGSSLAVLPLQCLANEQMTRASCALTASMTLRPALPAAVTAAFVQSFVAAMRSGALSLTSVGSPPALPPVGVRCGLVTIGGVVTVGRTLTLTGTRGLL